MPKTHTVALAALVAGAVPPSCGGGTGPTCLETDIHYAGSKSGTAYLIVTNDGGSRAFVHALSADSIQTLIAIGSQSQSCSYGGEATDIPLKAVVWIDVAGTAAPNCTDLLHPQPACQPAPTDPQAHQTGLLRFGQLTRIQLDVVP